MTCSDVSQDPCLSLAFDYAEHDLYEMLRHHRDKLHAPMDGATVKSVMWQLLNGLSYMEQNWLIHRDLKPSNILVMGDGEEQARFASNPARRCGITCSACNALAQMCRFSQHTARQTPARRPQ